MPEKTLDCRGLASPEAVKATREALGAIEAGEGLLVLVDSTASRIGVQTFAQGQGCTVEVAEERSGGYRLRLTMRALPRTDLSSQAPGHGSREDWAIAFRSEYFGQGAESVGRRLMDAFLYSLLEVRPRPGSLIFHNRGVFLTIRDAPFIDAIRELERQGAQVLVCGLCLDHYGLTEKLAVGRISNMYEMTEILARASKVFTP